MDPDPRLDALVRPLRDDVVSGASSLARSASDVLRRAAIRLEARSIDELRAGIGAVSIRILDAQPAMAPILALVREVLEAVEDADSLESGRHAAAAATESFRERIEEGRTRVVQAARGLLPVGGTVATISASGTIRDLLTTEAAVRGTGVVCFESRPANEGRGLAEALAAAGVEVTFAVDAAAHLLVPGCDAVLLGADSIGDRGVVNKIGSGVLADSARIAGVPVYVLADETKLLPRGFPQALDDDRPGAEVWEAPEGVRVWNRYFEVVPMAYVSGIVGESGVEDPRDVERRRERIGLPAGLRAWAAGLHPRGPAV